MKTKKVSNNCSTDLSTINTNSFSPKNNNNYTNNSNINNCQESYIINHSKKSTCKKTQNKKVFNDMKKQKDKKPITNKKNNNNNNLKAQKYVKPSNYTFNNHIFYINTQYELYNKAERYRINNIFKVIANNNEYRFNLNSNINTNRNENQQNTKNKIVLKNKNKKNSVNNGDIINKSNDINNNKYIESVLNQKVILIQSYCRGYFARNKLYNTLLIYSKFTKIFHIIQNKFNSYKNFFFNNIIFKSKNINDNNKEKNYKNIIVETTNNFSICNSNNTNMNSNKKNKKINYMICNVNNIDIIDNSNKIDNDNIFKNKQSIINYTICNINNINIIDNSKLPPHENKKGEIKHESVNNANNTDDIENNNKDDKSLFNEEKKIYEKKIKELTDENKNIKEENIQYQKNEDKYNQLKQENEKLISINEDINKQKDQLLIELKSTKEEYDKLLKEKVTPSLFNIIKQNEINIIGEKKDNINNSNINENITNINNNNINTNINSKPKDEKKEREKHLKNLFRNRVFEMRDYIHKCFIKFYYNGVFLQMTGKLNHIDNVKKTDNNDNTNILENNTNNDNKNDNHNINNDNEINKEKEKEKEDKEKQEINKEKEKEDKEKNELKERLKKSRGLRKLMNKKANERLELLRINFFKFYRAGIVSQFRNAKKRKTCHFKGNFNFGIANEITPEERIKTQTSKALTSKALKEKEELKKKTLYILGKIIFRADRRNMIIISKCFKKYLLKAKLESLKSIIGNDNVKKKKKKKGKKKNKSMEKENVAKDETDENNIAIKENNKTTENNTGV